MDKKQMKLYVWKQPYSVAYGQADLFVVAENLKIALELAQSKLAKRYSYNTLEGKGGYNHFKLFKPTRIVKLPCAEWHKWSE